MILLYCNKFPYFFAVLLRELYLGQILWPQYAVVVLDTHCNLLLLLGGSAICESSCKDKESSKGVEQQLHPAPA